MPVHKVLNPFINDDIRCEDTFNRLGNTIYIPVKKKNKKKKHCVSFINGQTIGLCSQIAKSVRKTGD